VKTINVPLDLPNAGRVARFALSLLLLPGAAGWAGCGSPPSVVPVLRVVERTMLDEADRIEARDADRDRLILSDARVRLRDGYLADLEAAQTLDPSWVTSATEVYVAACEALVYQEINLARQRQIRQDNLRDAAQAQARAIAILQQQDRLLEQTVGLNLWQLNPSDAELPQ